MSPSRSRRRAGTVIMPARSESGRPSPLGIVTASGFESRVRGVAGALEGSRGTAWTGEAASPPRLVNQIDGSGGGSGGTGTRREPPEPSARGAAIPSRVPHVPRGTQLGDQLDRRRLLVGRCRSGRPLPVRPHGASRPKTRPLHWSGAGCSTWNTPPRRRPHCPSTRADPHPARCSSISATDVPAAAAASSSNALPPVASPSRHRIHPLVSR